MDERGIIMRRRGRGLDLWEKQYIGIPGGGDGTEREMREKGP